MNGGGINFMVSLMWLFAFLIFFVYRECSVDNMNSQKVDKKWIYYLLIVISFGVFLVCNKHQFNVFNNYSYLAKALLEGHFDVPDMPEYLESVSFQGKKYMHFAPGGALVSMPFVAIWGVEGFNCTYLSMLLGACNFPIAVSVLYNMKIGTGIKDRIWLSSMLIFGTVHFFCASQGDSWFLGHVSTLFFLLLAMMLFTKNSEESRGKRLFWAGFCFGFAVTCRMAALFGFVFFAGYMALRSKRWKKDVLIFGAGAALIGFWYMAYNYVRYGTIMDMGYQLTYLKDMHRDIYDRLQMSPINDQQQLLKQFKAEYGGPLQLKHIKNNLYSIFLLPPAFQREFPYIIPTVAGMAVTFTSPMLYCAALANWKKKRTCILGITVFLTAIPFLMNYGNGTAQFGMRYSMDFTPYLWLLMCYGLTRKGEMRLWMKVGIGLCIFIQGWGTLFWTYFYR